MEHVIMPIENSLLIFTVHYDTVIILKLTVNVSDKSEVMDLTPSTLYKARLFTV